MKKLIKEVYPIIILISLLMLLLITTGHNLSANDKEIISLGIKERQIRDNDIPLFVFATIGDPHIIDDRMLPPGDDTKYLKANSIAKELLMNYVQDVNKHNPNVDFTIVLGDISDKGRSWELNKAASILNQLNSPYYPIVGNHDNFQSDNKMAWKTAFGYSSTNYTFGYRGFNFIVADATLNPYIPPDYVVLFDDPTINWVKSELIKNSNTPTIFINHYNLINHCWTADWSVSQQLGNNSCVCMYKETATENQSLSPTGPPPTSSNCHYYGDFDGAKELRNVLENYGNVILAINGHVHANDITTYNGLTEVSVGATSIGKPSIRYFTVYSNKVVIDYAYISNKTLFDHVVHVCSLYYDQNPNDYITNNNVCNFIDGDISDKRTIIYF